MMNNTALPPRDNNTAGSQSGVRYNTTGTISATPGTPNPTAPTAFVCYRADGTAAGCSTDGTACATGSAGTLASVAAPSTGTGTSTTVSAITCASGLIPSDPVTATYNFTVQTVSITPTGATTCTAANTPAGCYEPTSSTNFYNFTTPTTQTVTFGTAKANTGGTQTTGTTGETVRYAYQTGSVGNALPTVADVACDGTDLAFGTAAPAGETRAVCTPDTPTANCTIAALPPFSVVKAIACKANYAASPERTLTYANPDQTVNVSTPTPAAPGPYSNDTPLSFATTPAQPTTVPLGTNDVNVCWTQSVSNALTPTCSAATGACTTPTGAPAAGDTYGRYNPCVGGTGATCTVTKSTDVGFTNGLGTTTTAAGGFAQPVVTVTGTVVKAIACRAGIPASPVAQSAPYVLKVATPVLTANGAVTYNSPLAFSTTTTTTGANAAQLSYRRSDSGTTAATPSCSGTIATQQVQANAPVAVNFTNNCGDGLGTACAPQEEFKVIGCKNGYLPSDVATGDYTTTLPAPTFAPAGDPARGYFTNQQAISVTDVIFGAGLSNARICYTTDNGTPQCGTGSTCTALDGVPQTATSTATVNLASTALPSGTTIKALACADSYAPSPLTTSTYDFHVQAYSILPATGAQTGGAKSVSFVNDGGGAGICTGGTAAGTACTVATTPTTCAGVGATCVADPTTSGARTGAGAVVLCYSIDGNPVTTCSEAFTAPATQRVFCSDGVTNGAATSTFNTASGTWAPTNLQNIATTTTVNSRVCKDGYVSASRAADPYTFGAYSRAEPIDGNNTFSATDNRIATSFSIASIAATTGVDTTAAATGGASYISFTSTDMYVGFQGAALTSGVADYFQFYLLGTGTTLFTGGTNTADVGASNQFGDGNFTANPALANVHFFVNPAGGTSTAGVRIYNAAGNWVTPSSVPDFSVAFGGTLGTANAYVEFRISRTALGLADANANLTLSGSIYAPTSGTKGVKFPASQADNTTPYTWGYFQENMSSAALPSSTLNLHP